MSSVAEALCQSCGFCCDGTLFSSVPLRAQEGAGLALRVIAREDGSSAFQQPCAALQAEGCVVYAQRPSACRAYRCDLLTALEESEVGLDEAQELVERVRGAGRHLDSLLPPSADPAQSLRFRALGAQLTHEAAAALRRWELLLTNHFRGRRG